jgi:hypothetical protein
VRRATRARDADRSATCAILDSALVDGQLDTVEHRERIAAAMTATTLAELAALTTDLQTPTRAPVVAARPPRSGPGPRVYLAGVALVLCVGLVVTMCGLASARPEVSTPPGAAGAVASTDTDLFSAAGWQAMLAWLRSQHGGTVVVGATVYPTYAVIEVLEPDDARHTRRVLYPPRSTRSDITGNRKLDGPLVDLAGVDDGAVRALLATAPERLNVSNPTSRYVLFGFPTRPVDQIGVYVSNDHKQSGMLTATVRGEVLSVSPVEG